MLSIKSASTLLLNFRTSNTVSGLMRHNPALNYLLLKQHQRNLRGVRKIFRQPLPRFKNNLMHLSPLTELLTTEAVLVEGTKGQRPIESLSDLWSRKLDVYKQYLSPNESTVLLEALFNSNNDIDKLLRVIDCNLPTMTSFYVATSLEALDDMMRFGCCDIETVIVSPELKRLCTKALYKIRFFEADEMLRLIKCMSTIRLPEDSLLAQSAFQMARHMINEFNSEELATLNRCLDTFEVLDASQKSLLLALKHAVPIVQKNLTAQKLFTRLDSVKRLTDSK